MFRNLKSPAILGAAGGFAFSLAIVPAQATAVRTFVSATGSDSGTCSRAAPCRTLAFAIGATTDGGEVSILDTAGYGAVTINNSISIVNPGGVEAGISVSGGATAVTVSGSGVVNLRGLTIEGNGTGSVGIAFVGTGTLNVIDCTVRNMTHDGIRITPSSGGVIVIADTTVANNHDNGIYATGDGSGSDTLTLSHVKSINNGFSNAGAGFQFVGGIMAYGFATIDSSLFAGNGIGIKSSATGSNQISTFLINSNVVNNNVSANIGSGTTLKLEKATLSAYLPGQNIINGGSIQSFGDNAITDSITGAAVSHISLQ